LFYVACTRAQDVLVLLEGKGDARYLREEKGARHVWCHQVWDVLGRARLAAFVARGAPEETLALAGGGTVRVERAARYLDPAGATARLVAARPEALALRPSELAALAADLRAATAALRGEIAAGLAIVGREVPFVLALPAGTPRVFLHGRLDLLARRGPAHVVRDYKYARPAPAALESYAPQLGAYQLAVGAAGAAEVEAELVFLRGGPAVLRRPPLGA